MTSEVVLRDVSNADLAVFFEQQLDPVANHMAAFTSRDPTDRDAFDAHWAKIIGNDTVVMKTIVVDGQVVGHVAKYERLGKPEVTYWIGKKYWGQGFATKALSAFLGYVAARPLYGCAAKDNIASIRVLEKCGFTTCGHQEAFAKARGVEVEEVIMKLE